MTVYARVARNYVGIVIAQLKKANGVKILRGVDPKAQLQELCITSRMRADLTYILEDIDSMGYPMFEYKICK